MGPTGLAALAKPATTDASLLGGSEPLAEKAFVFEAIATSGNEILARFTMPKGYYLYRDKTSFALVDAGGATLVAPRWLRGQAHTDENFGATTVYFDQVEVPLAVSRTDPAPRAVTVETRFRGA